MDGSAFPSPQEPGGGRPEGDEGQYDVVIVGAGISGINAAYRLTESDPTLTYKIFEGRERLGGTWDLFKYPGIRCDSEMSTLAFPFRPWEEKSLIGSGYEIRDYLEDTARENGIYPRIEFQTYVKSAAWSSEENLWTVKIVNAAGTERTVKGRYIYLGTGYYDYGSGYTPDFPGLESFGGQMIHPQHWPEDLPLKDKKAVIIGSGATAITLVPAMADEGAEVTMLQRSPTYVIAMPSSAAPARALRAVFGRNLGNKIERWRSHFLGDTFYKASKAFPGLIRNILQRRAQSLLGKNVSVDPHFTPKYNPWDQRLCLDPDAKLFKTLRKGKAKVVTDHIERFDETGIQLKSGDHLDADIVVSATGLNVKMFGDIDLSVDGRPIDPADHFVYRGMMLDGVPNFFLAIGYVNASWTLKVDLTAQLAASVIGRAKAGGHQRVAAIPLSDMGKESPLLDLTSGYVQRALERLPRQGAEEPWVVHQDFKKDIKSTREGMKGDEAVKFDPSPDQLKPFQPRTPSATAPELQAAE
ncbi:putative monooxygenase [Parvularcula bermudensis HTCC2503]|uniref:Putative monooxygenase n=1 Tax=Parvularcula bermudensis (strain ATCC BAA-594 / HTCC2503 / KCTC 12087) TaxID=314260 RepID=E0TBD0_PARBH|nr:NAD(P)/FAD-dependent oxidoreductase [Parvularcula bermudensis]ADM08334.1 putative monooxygenase [Parvularcula bermudensis HTCC2503]